jgi:hypothetical protein
MTALVPIQYESEVVSVDRFDRPSEILSRCSFDDGQIPYIASLIAVNVGCLLFAIFQAYQARHLSTEFGESSYVFKALLITFLVGLVGVPVLLLARDNTNASTFVASAILFVTGTSILLVIYVPKISHLRKNGNKEVHFRHTLSVIAARVAFLGPNEGSSFFGRPNDSQPSTENRSTHLVGSSQVSGIDLSNRSSLVEKDSLPMSSQLSGIQVYGVETKEELILENESLKIENARLRRRINCFEVGLGNNAEYMHASSTTSIPSDDPDSNTPSNRGFSLSSVAEGNEESVSESVINA